MSTPANAPYKVEQRKYRDRARHQTLLYSPYPNGPAKVHVVNGETRYRPWARGELHKPFKPQSREGAER